MNLKEKKQKLQLPKTTMNMQSTIRCSWCQKDDLYRNYHDTEWGKPIKDDALLFEYLVLESFQAGLSWYCILKKREGFRAAFDDFDYHKIALYSDEKINQLLGDEKIVRNKLKIYATINNAEKFIGLQKEKGSFSQYIWSFTDYKIIENLRKEEEIIPSSTPLSVEIAKDLKRRGFKFLGPTVVYAFLQAVGIVNDHLDNCSFR